MIPLPRLIPLWRLVVALVAALLVSHPAALGAAPDSPHAPGESPPATAATDQAAPPAAEPRLVSGTWLELDVGIIGAASDDILKTAMETVHGAGYAGLIIKLDTPGGALDSTRSMVKAMMAADFPIVVWVGPAGSRAGSAGAFITLAGHVAAMAPGTNIGAAHPVQASGDDVEDGEMGRKVTNDTVAFIESIAQSRGRNIEMARSFVATSVSITAEEALEHEVIDFLAQDLESLMEQLDGRTLDLRPGLAVTLQTATAPRVVFEKSLRQSLLEILSNPNLFYLLFMAGLIGLGYELTHPGMLFPGVVGGISLILALIATSVLPISYGAAALILVGIAMLVAEAFVASFGILGIGGLIAFVLGSVFLVDPANEAGLRISWYAIAPGAVTIGLAFLTLGYLVVRSGRAPVASGREALIGAQGTALGDFEAGRGQIRVNGTIWSAHLGPNTMIPVAKGDRVEVTAIHGLELEVVRRS